MQGLIRRIAGPLLGVVLGLTAMAAYAQHTPEKLDGVTIVTAEEVQKLMKDGVPVVDTRVANEYAEEHVKGAKNVPYKEKSAKAVNFDSAQDSFDLSKLPQDKNAPVVLYCNAGECWKSYKSSVVALRAGYKKIYWFRGGMPEWKSKKLPTE
ncbi:MAG TPA: rhodanese-like domain-containing protein [Usitatibacter sp.]|nr:rhodanese-like domain-containing protein [Usitatibacter sp.]